MGIHLGISYTLPHTSPEEWAQKHYDLGLRAVVFPVDYTAPDGLIDAYAKAAHDRGLVIAEVGAWCNPISPDWMEKARALERCVYQLQLCDHVGGLCTVNIAGAMGPVWDGPYRENFTPEAYRHTVETVQSILQQAAPQRAQYTLEGMPWMIPDGPEMYLSLLYDIDDPAFAAHLDLANWINCPERYYRNETFAETCFTMLYGQVRSCHLKDVRLDPVSPVHLSEVPCGQGELNLRAYARMAHEANANMPMIIEHLKDEAAYRDSVAYVQQLLRGHVPVEGQA